MYDRRGYALVPSRIILGLFNIHTHLHGPRPMRVHRRQGWGKTGQGRCEGGQKRTYRWKDMEKFGRNKNDGAKKKPGRPKLSVSKAHTI